MLEVLRLAEAARVADVARGRRPTGRQLARGVQVSIVRNLRKAWPAAEGEAVPSPTVDQHEAFPDHVDQAPARPHLAIVRKPAPGCHDAPVTDEPFWLALGAFMTSSGFGGLMAAVAAGIAYLGIRHRLQGDKDIAEKDRTADAEAAVTTDGLERWWDAYMWLWENHEKLGQYERALAIASLRDSMVHKAHGGILEALASVLMDNGGGPSVQSQS